MDKLIASNVYGTKSITLDQYPDEAWEFLTGDPNANAESVKEMWAAVPWLYRGVNIIAQASAEIPVSLYRGNTEITSSEEWKDPTGYLPDIAKLIRKLAASITLEGQGYLFRDQAATVRATKRLVFWNPTSVSVDWKKTQETRELWFIRRVNGRDEHYSYEQVLYFWPDDGYTEVGPPLSSPAKAALAAAGVLYNADEYVAAYWKRGAVKATMLAVKGNPSDVEKKKLTDWWKSVTGGIKKAFSIFTFNAEAVSPIMVGEGLEGLSNNAMTVEKREDISTALGVPQSILFSTNAGGLGGSGVVNGDRINFYELTIIPLVRLICGTLNEQQLNQQGYHLAVNENEMAIYQKDEAERSAGLSNIVNALEKPAEFLLAADIIGYEIDDEQRARIEALINERKANAERMAEVMKPKDEPKPEPEQDEAPNEMQQQGKTAWADDVARWRRKALKAGGYCEFVSDVIPDGIHNQIVYNLKAATSPNEIKAAFDVREQPAQDDALAKRGIYPGIDEFRLLCAAVKTAQYYRRVFMTNASNLYNDKITVNEFDSTLATLIYNQLFAAWREGMVNVGLDPRKDFTQEMSDIVSEIAAEEVGYLRDFALDIVAARANENLTGITARVEMWANRYLDVVNRSEIFCKPNDLFQWRLGATEKHCTDCAGYAGRIMTGREWAKEKRPQGRDLACHGYNCDCELVPVVRV